MAGDPDPFEATLTTIELVQTSLSSGAPAAGEGRSWTQDEVEAQLAQLKEDAATLREHWNTSSSGVVGGSEPVRCAACGEPMACPTARALFAKYR